MSVHDKDLVDAGYRFYQERLDKPYRDGTWYKTIRNRSGKGLYQIGVASWKFPGVNEPQLSAKASMHLDDMRIFWLEYQIRYEATIEEVESFYAKAYSSLGCIPDPHND